MIWYIIISLLIFELTAIIFFLPKSLVISMITAERASSVRWFGEEKTQSMIASSEETYRRIFVDSGFKEVVYDTFYTDQRIPENEKVFSWVNDERLFTAVNDRLESLFLLLGVLRPSPRNRH